jgi:hypothetical protein
LFEDTQIRYPEFSHDFIRAMREHLLKSSGHPSSSSSSHPLADAKAKLNKAPFKADADKLRI